MTVSETRGDSFTHATFVVGLLMVLIGLCLYWWHQVIGLEIAFDPVRYVDEIGICGLVPFLLLIIMIVTAILNVITATRSKYDDLAFKANMLLGAFATLICFLFVSHSSGGDPHLIGLILGTLGSGVVMAAGIIPLLREYIYY